MAPGEEFFEAGDSVRIVDVPGELEGVVGKLMRSLGRGRWAVSMDGKTRSTVVNEKNLEKYEEPAAGHSVKVRSKPTPYHMVGTWDDWEPHEMEWNGRLGCFELGVTLGNDGVESFKFLVDGEWDACVYPDQVGANCHTSHTVCGPDDGGVDSEWTIGLHQADVSKPGANYKVRIFLAVDGTPQKVDWLLDPPEDQANNTASNVAHKVSPDFTEYNNRLQAPSANFPTPAPPKDSRNANETADVEDQVQRWRLSNSLSPGNVDEASQVEARERAARVRLERRLQEAAEAEMQAITDGDPGTIQPADQEQARVDARVAENKRRYIAYCGTRKERAQQVLNTASPEEADKFERLRQQQPPSRT